MHAPLSPDAPSYARELEHRALRAEASLAALEDGLNSLRAYLASDKFTPTDGRRNGYVNVADVFLRLDEASFAASQADADATIDPFTLYACNVVGGTPEDAADWQAVAEQAFEDRHPEPTVSDARWSGKVILGDYPESVSDWQTVARRIWEGRISE